VRELKGNPVEGQVTKEEVEDILNWYYCKDVEYEEYLQEQQKEQQRMYDEYLKQQQEEEEQQQQQQQQLQQRQRSR